MTDDANRKWNLLFHRFTEGTAADDAQQSANRP
jgi:hypothetical protein